MHITFHGPVLYVLQGDSVRPGSQPLVTYEHLTTRGRTRPRECAGSLFVTQNLVRQELLRSLYELSGLSEHTLRNEMQHKLALTHSCSSIVGLLQRLWHSDVISGKDNSVAEQWGWVAVLCFSSEDIAAITFVPRHWFFCLILILRRDTAALISVVDSVYLQRAANYQFVNAKSDSNSMWVSYTWPNSVLACGMQPVKFSDVSKMYYRNLALKRKPREIIGRNLPVIAFSLSILWRTVRRHIWGTLLLPSGSCTCRTLRNACLYVKLKER